MKLSNDDARNGTRNGLRFLALLGTVAAVAACSRLEDRVEITESREISTYAPAPAPITSSFERFHVEEDAPAPPRENPLTWVTPDGWKDAGEETGGDNMRLINLRFGANDEGECYLAAMPGAAGGLEANVNRWRAQMGLPEQPADEVSKLPKKHFLRGEATYVVLDGDFKRMGATEAAKGYRMVGLIQPAPEFTLFVKMTGPKDLVANNEAAFDQLVQSISIKR